jgi:cytoskeletal protein RodZ
MDRYSPRLLRGVAAAGVSLFLVAGAAFAANAVMGAPRSTSRDFVPVAASSPSGTSKVEATETAEPSETPDSTTGTDKPDSTTGTTKPGEKAEGTEKAEGAGKVKATVTAEPTEKPEPSQSPKATGSSRPTETPHAEDRSGKANGQSGEHQRGDEHARATATPAAGAPARMPAATPGPTHSNGNGTHDGGNG